MNLLIVKEVDCLNYKVVVSLIKKRIIECRLYFSRALVNHSCDANAEIQYQHNNSTLSVVATRLISNNEVCLKKKFWKKS